MERNKLCWCGSGRKYKQCHMHMDEKLALLASQGHIVPDRSILKTPEQISAIRKSADLNTAILDHVANHIQAGMSTADIDRLVHDFTVQHGGIPAPLGYEGFPKSVCTSINNEICHGIPDEEIILQDGDIINVDVSTILDGYYSDASRMFAIGTLSERAEKLLRVTKECVEMGKKYFSVASGGGTGRTLHPDNMAAGPASYGMTDTMGRMHSDAQFAGSSSVPAHVEMMGLIGMGNNPMVGATVAVAVAISQSLNK